MTVEQVIKALPKAELHIHLEGAILPQTAMELADKNGVELPKCENVEDLYVFGDLGDFLAVYGLISKSIVDLSDFHRITYEMLRSVAQGGGRYVEFFISPHAHEGVNFALQFEGIRNGIKDAEHDFGIRAVFAPGINRELGPDNAEEYLDEILRCRCDELVGIGLDYNEAPFPPEPYAKVFERAGKNGLHLTAHAGENGPASNINHSLDVLKTERIDHGYHIVDDPALVARCRDEGVMFTCCPSTTTFTTIWRDLSDPMHAIRQMKDAGLLLTINSDDPPMFGTDLNNEYLIAHNELGFSLEDLKGSILTGVQHSWLDNGTKKDWLASWGKEIDDLLAS